MKNIQNRCLFVHFLVLKIVYIRRIDCKRKIYLFVHAITMICKLHFQLQRWSRLTACRIIASVDPIFIEKINHKLYCRIGLDFLVRKDNCLAAQCLGDKNEKKMQKKQLKSVDVTKEKSRLTSGSKNSSSAVLQI